MPPPRRSGSRRVRSAVPNVFGAVGPTMSARSADALFGRQPPGARRGVFENAYQRVKNNFEVQGYDTEDLPEYGDEVFSYDPTRSSNPPRPRTLRAGWVRPKGSDTGTVVVQFRQGAVYEYDNVPYNVWRNFRRVQSPGRAMNRSNGLIGGGYPYRRVYG